MFPIYHSLYKHLPPLFPHQPGSTGGTKIDLTASAGIPGIRESGIPVGPGNLMDSNHIFAAAAAAAMEQVAAASKLGKILKTNRSFEFC